jgi:Arc/MetJ-type ribon-helix-helix transcriptional regulator
MKTLMLELPEQLTEEIDALVENGWFVDKNEVIRAALREFVRHNRFVLAEEFQRADIAWALQLHRAVQREDPAPQ